MNSQDPYIPTYCESCNRKIDMDNICDCLSMQKCMECDYRIGDGYYHKSSCSYYVKPQRSFDKIETVGSIESKRSSTMTMTSTVSLDPTFEHIGVPLLESELKLKSGSLIMNRKPSLDISTLSNRSGFKK